MPTSTAPRDVAFPIAAEAALLRALREGDERAYEELVRTHAPRLLAVARRMLRCEEDARDAVQEALVSAFRAVDRFDGRCRLATWLHRITVNAALMRLRRSRRRPEESLETLLPRFMEDGHHVADVCDWSNEAETLLLRRETRDRVHEAITRLPSSYREVLLLRDMEELTTSEAASLLGVSEAAVKIRLHRARQALRSLIEAELERTRPAAAAAPGLAPAQAPTARRAAAPSPRSAASRPAARAPRPTATPA